MTENKGDLISREALKIEIEKQIAYCDDKSKHQSDMEEILRYSNTSYGLRLAHNYIDNAPTVEITEEQAIDKLHETGWLPLHDKEMTERLHGEWIICYRDNKGIHKIKCPFCKYVNGSDFGGLITLTFDRLPPFCENCGAQMGDGAE